MISSINLNLPTTPTIHRQHKPLVLKAETQIKSDDEDGRGQQVDVKAGNEDRVNVKRPE